MCCGAGPRAATAEEDEVRTTSGSRVELQGRHRRHGRGWRGTALVLGAALAAVIAAPAAAIVGGQEDTANAYPNVGAVQFQFDGQWFTGCTGTLVASDVVLTAAHCTGDVVFGNLQPSDLRVTFDAAPGETPTAYIVDAVMPHPDFWASAPSPARGINAKNYLGPGAEDIAILRLVESVAGIAPAPIAGLGYLDGLDLRTETFTAVGYGIIGFTQGSLVSPGAFGIDGFGSRNFADVQILNLHDAYPNRYVKISAANCPGDSGGPLLHGSTVVGITVWTNSLRCEGPGLDYRVDSSIAQAFLAANL
jgi:hypothetical protein